LADGYFLEPTLITGATDAMAISSQEVFGPVAVPYKFQSVDEVIARANASPYGLAGGVWTRDISLARGVSERLKVGTVWINCWERFDVVAPFGGTKASGYGRDMGEEVLEEFTDLKTIWLDAEVFDAER
jgi:acyl-CoA reductase-like NAD-dependent aldehyde dehydrogenase